LENSSDVTYTGTWYPNSGSFNLDGMATLAMAAGSKAEFKFTGPAVKWIGFSDPWSGIAQVYVDGKMVATVDTYSATQKAQATQYSISGLANRAHTLTIAVTGTCDANSQGDWVWVNAFEVYAPAASAKSSVTASAVHGTSLVLDSNIVGR
jgi:hypothetical protein